MTKHIGLTVIVFILISFSFFNAGFVFAESTNMALDGGWSFDEDWMREHAYVKGNMTRLLIGVDVAKPNAEGLLKNLALLNGGEIVNTFGGGQTLTLVAECPLEKVSSFVAKIKASGLVRYIEPNFKVGALLIPNDPHFLTYQRSLQKIEADWAWNYTTGSQDIVIALIDSGVGPHPDLDANIDVGLGYDFVNNDTDPKDDYGHGTHCAGIIAAVLNNSIGIAGIAQVPIMPLKVLNEEGIGFVEWIANAIYYAVNHGACIISMSLGLYEFSQTLYDAVSHAYENGVLLVAAAGNENTTSRAFPASFDEVIAIGATDQNDIKADFSNWATGLSWWRQVWTFGLRFEYH